jgi:subtilisin family serine protease
VICKVLVVDTGATPTIRPLLSTSNDDLSDPAKQAKKLLESVRTPVEDDPWDADRNLLLDPFSGHGTFIAGIIAGLAPGCAITVERGLTSYGDTDDVAVARSLMEHFPAGAGAPPFDIVSLSFSGFCDEDDPPLALSEAIATIQSRYRTDDDYSGSHEIIREQVVFVAAAGNDATCRPTWPASFESVISVGALGPDGRAPFSNFGPWVQACAPGVEIHSTFFDLSKEVDAREDNRDFEGWATWSGTSFSTPIVAAEIAWEWMNRELDGRVGEAAAWLLERDSLFRFPWLGTVVNSC